MKLLYVCEAVGEGIAEYAIRQSQALSNAGLEVIFLCRPEFPVARLAKVEVVASLPSQPAATGKVSRLIERSGDSRRIAKVVLKTSQGCDISAVLFACYVEYFAPLWAPILRKLARQGVMIGTIAHDPVRDFVLGPYWWHRWSVRQAYSFVSHVFVHDETPVDYGGAAPEGLVSKIIPHGAYEVAAPRRSREELRGNWGLTRTDRVFLSFGQIRDGKNLDLFLEAMVDAPPEVKLLVAGSGGGGAQRPPSFYQELATSLGIADRCRWDVRHVPDDEVGELFLAADVVLVTYSAQFRSASGVLNAAVACRKPVLASSGAGPLKHAVEHYHLGVFIPPDEIDAMRGGVMEVLEAEESPEWERYLKENSWEENANRVIDSMKLLELSNASTDRLAPDPA